MKQLGPQCGGTEGSSVKGIMTAVGALIGVDMPDRFNDGAR